MGARNHDSWDISEQEFPEGGSIEAQLRFLLRFAILAPSPKNSQPWAFAISKGRQRAANRKGMLLIHSRS